MSKWLTKLSNYSPFRRGCCVYKKVISILLKEIKELKDKIKVLEKSIK